MFVINHNNYRSSVNLKNIIYCKPIRTECKAPDDKSISARYKIKTLYDEDSLNSVSELKRVVLISPKLEINTNWSNLKYQTIKIPLEPLVGPVLKFYNIINDIELKAFEELKRIFGDNFNFKSILSEINHNGDLFLDDEEFNITILTLKLAKNLTTFDHVGKKININMLESQNNIYKLVIEYTELWYDKETNTGGCNFNIVQIKHFPQYYEDDLITNDKPIDSQIVVPFFKLGGPPIAPPIPTSGSITCNNINIVSTIANSISNNVVPLIKPPEKNKNNPFTIDKNTLCNALGRLRKTS